MKFPPQAPPRHLSRILLAVGANESSVILVGRGLIENDMEEVGSDAPADLSLETPDGTQEAGLYVFTFQLSYTGASEDGYDLQVADPVVRSLNAHELAAVADGEVASIYEMWSDVPTWEALQGNAEATTSTDEVMDAFDPEPDKG